MSADGMTRSDIASTLALTVEVTVDAIRRHHPALPPVVVIFDPAAVRDHGSVKVRKGFVGPDGDHQLPASWLDKRSRSEVPEMRITTRVLNCPASDLLHVVLRHLATLLVYSRGGSPFTRQGRYFTPQWRDAARELGLEVLNAGKASGWSQTRMMDEATARYGYVLKRLEAGMIAYRLSIPYAGRVSAEPADPRAEGIGTSDGGSRLPNAEAGSDSIADDDGRIDAARGTYGPRGRGEASERNGVADGSSDQAIHEPQGASDAPGNTREGVVDGDKGSAGNESSADSPEPKKRRGSAPPRKGGASEVQLRCDCEDPAFQIKVNVAYLHGPGATCNGCGCIYRKDMRKSSPFGTGDAQAGRRDAA